MIYATGNEWALYRDGERVGPLVRLPGKVDRDGAAAADRSSAERLVDQLRTFFRWEPLTPTSPRELAKLLAPLCRLLRENVQSELNVEGSPLRALAADWRRYLFSGPDTNRARRKPVDPEQLFLDG